MASKVALVSLLGSLSGALGYLGPLGGPLGLSGVVGPLVARLGLQPLSRQPQESCKFTISRGGLPPCWPFIKHFRVGAPTIRSTLGANTRQISLIVQSIPILVTAGFALPQYVEDLTARTWCKGLRGLSKT